MIYFANVCSEVGVTTELPVTEKLYCILMQVSPEMVVCKILK